MASKKCRHTVHVSVDSKQYKEEQINWWNRLIDAIEEGAVQPDLNEQTEMLKQIFPEQLLYKILHILDIVPSSGISLTSSNEWIFISPPKELSKEDLHSVQTIESDGRRKRYNIGRINPYMEFFKRDPKRAAIWRPLPPLSLDEMHLTQKADAVAERIAKDFVDWMVRLCQQDGVTQTTLTVEDIMKMFDIGFNTQAARTLCVRFKEIATVPEQVAYLKQVPKLARRNVLFRQIQRDIEASQQERKLLAFGSILPVDLQVHPPSCEEIKSKWFGCERIREDLRSMATVFQDVTHLATTRGFCRYLLEHPEIPPPTYLKDRGLLDLRKLDEMEATVDDDDDYYYDDHDDIELEFSFDEPQSVENTVEEEQENVVQEDDDDDELFDEKKPDDV